MWEFCVAAEKANKNVLEYIDEKTIDIIKECGGIKTLCTENDYLTLCFAVKKSFKEKLQKKLKKVLCDAICEKLKHNFLFNNIHKNTQDESLFETFVKVYTYFDIELEKEIVFRSLFFPKELNLSSFLNFRLFLLKQKWQEMCCLANKNSKIFLKNESFVDLLKFLIENLDYKCDKIIIDGTNHKIFAQTGDKKELLTDCLEQNNILNQIIEFAPKNIVIVGKTSQSITKLLQELFGNRVEKREN